MTSEFRYFPDQANAEEMDSDTTEWLMQATLTEHTPTDWTLVDAVSEAIAILGDIDQQMLHLVFYERKSFQQAAKATGLKAKSYAWRKTKLALDNLEEILRSNPKLMQAITDKYLLENES